MACHTNSYSINDVSYEIDFSILNFALLCLIIQYMHFGKNMNWKFRIV